MYALSFVKFYNKKPQARQLFVPDPGKPFHEKALMEKSVHLNLSHVVKYMPMCLWWWWGFVRYRLEFLSWEPKPAILNLHFCDIEICVEI